VTVPLLLEVAPRAGPASGGDLVSLRATGLADVIAVYFGATAVAVETRREEAGGSILRLKTPAHTAALVDVSIQNLDAAGVVVPGEFATLPGAYRFQRARLVRESNLTRLLRALLRELKRQLLENVSLTVALDYGDDPLDNRTALAKLPALVVSGPRLRENRAYSSNVLREELVVGMSGPELRRRRPAYTVDVELGLTGASDRATELLNVEAAVATFFRSTPWLVLDRDPENLAAGNVRFELDPVGDLRTDLEGKDDVRAFNWGLVIRAFDLDDGLPLDLTRVVSGTGASLAVGPLPTPP